MNLKIQFEKSLPIVRKIFCEVMHMVYGRTAQRGAGGRYGALWKFSWTWKLFE